MNSQYKKSYLKKITKYLKLHEDKYYEFHKSRGINSNSYEERIRVKLPTIEGFARFLGVSRKTVYNWKEENPDFAEELEKIIDEQLRRLINGGLEGTYNPTIAKLMLASNHGMRDGIDATSKGESINYFNDEQIDRIAQRISHRKTSDGDESST